MKITQELLDAYYLGTCSEAEAQLVEDWLRSGTPFDQMPPPPKSSFWQRVVWRRLNPHQKRKVYYPTALAASILLCICLTAIWYTNRPYKHYTPFKSVATKPGQRLHLTLPDSSVVYLNAGSRITYPEVFKENNREVQMEGEVFFDVHPSPQKPFTVRGPHSTIQVLGTSFNVIDNPDNAHSSITVATGKVTFRPTDAQTGIEVNPNEQAILLVGGRISKQKVIASHHIGWKDNKLLFNNVALPEVIQTLEKWFAVKICLEDVSLRKERFTGSFTNPSLSQVLQLMSFSIHFTYKKQDQCINITRMKYP